MKENWSKTDKYGKIRLVILLLICLWCAYCVIAYSYEIYNLEVSSNLIDVKNMGPMLIDGSDFTGIFKLIGTGSNIMVVSAVLGIYGLATAVMCLVPLILFWFIGIRRAEFVSLSEAELAKNICGIGGVISLIGGILITRFNGRMPAVFLTLIWLLPSFIIVVIPLRKKIEQ
ncbi:MAG: hypothetical protein IKR23_04900 [Lachnospiraceae bacterium]|nr:hypothetical protein [Lachnospiraceae bacterium]